MAYIITIQDLKTHIYEEIADEITRDDESIQQEAIDSAIGEVQGYLCKFDIDKLLGTPDTDAVKVFPVLKFKTKDVVRWYLITLGVPNINYEDARIRYEDARDKYFAKIQAGAIIPKGWPYLDTTQNPPYPQGDSIYSTSNPKRRNRY